VLDIRGEYKSQSTHTKIPFIRQNSWSQHVSAYLESHHQATHECVKDVCTVVYIQPGEISCYDNKVVKIMYKNVAAYSLPMKVER
jgi:hypothetical protein